ncbi:hypothetical protein SAY86_019786 [Trapa natans]|uniref:VQ domain-containing protein n=1 Tax=Trapa natans TaxID=22666 RepID=A0AAN7LYC0_TRANT|nr:hypothetical protein SAY86_019786 [Trapa natans]
MDSLGFPPAGKSPRRELQGPRPTPLSIRKDSHKIRKPPLPAHHPHSQVVLPQPQQPLQPVIIYAVSPKIIHTDPSEFMALVQRLTGPSPKYAAAAAAAASTVVLSPQAVNPFSYPNGAVSPAARYASVEMAAKSPGSRRLMRWDNGGGDDDVAALEGVDVMDWIERMGTIPGILSPGPLSLQPIPVSFFNPTTSEENPLSFLQDWSPAVLYSNKNLDFSELNALLQSPVIPPFISPRSTATPFPSVDLFNNFFDL